MAFTQWVQSPIYTDVAGVDGFNAFQKKYGAVGDGSHDDTTALQNSANDAIAANGGIWFIPPPPKYYKTTSTITVQAQGGNGGLFALCPGGGFTPINYQGPSGTAAFVIDGSIGWGCKFYGLSVNLGGTGAANQIAFDFQFNGGDNIPSLKMERCNVGVQGSGGYHVGFRLGQAPDGGSNISNTIFDQCSITGEGSQHGSIGWQLGGSQAKSCLFLNCNANSLGQMFLAEPITSYLAAPCLATDTTLMVFDTFLFPNSGTISLGGSEQVTYTGKTLGSLPGTPGTLTGCTRGTNGTVAQAWANGISVSQYVPGQGVYTGVDDWVWIGGGASGCARDFCGSGKVEISNFRGENGQHFYMSSYMGGTYSGASAILLKSITLSSYTEPADGYGVISLSNNDRVKVQGLKADGVSTLFDSGFLTNKSTNQANGSVWLEDFYIPASYPFWNLINNWPIHAHGTLLNTGGSALRRVYVDIEPPITLTDAATVTVDFSSGTEQYLLFTAAQGLNRAVAFINASAGMKIDVYFQQPAAGGGPSGVNSWSSGITWKGGSPPTFSTAANAIDKITFTVLGAGSYFGSY